MTYIPEKGDIIHLRFDPASGKEMQGDHFALVVSAKAFNKAMGLVFACPISQGKAEAARGMLSSLLGSGTHTQGNIHCHQLKSLDWKARKAALKEKVPDYVVQDVLSRIAAILELD
ncbi:MULTISPECIES: type II toxin-antitoxin system PemK/MazF family toxin [unclassified Neisseria]|uniref:type II toxin-antitoxin system PemK/MazF family toxin n=1 Tax=unclassified Neisseria TaxID=2623750 RepID=UPI0026668D83|nr:MULTISPECIES: type II toxin-antitoxin system PemK/MazF family toxin [unclassified Neisseria]MDO1509504.1 type II toxin-antitoxin system PemK/MazF family toxin [Neisseria sp. MVDL19-042950]MDO1515724.1 type II toxin-antitoxin system PemK/MazF family toxin [Neisseria sp. MVDL18-041461]MDO1563452.1 type II toxin-antitoxin system PemK/MazF family toxin [Neisseria sp. MVDL20-010259]